MYPATLTILFKFQTTWVVSTVFLCRVVSFLANGTLQGNDWANIFLGHIVINAPIGIFLGANLLLYYVSDYARSNRQTAFTDRKLRTFLQRHRRDQLHRQVHIVPGHHHLHTFRQL